MVEEIGDKRLYIKRERERESVSACVLASSFTIQSFGRSFIQVALLGNRDGSDPSAHLRNMTRLFPFFAYHLRWVYIPKTHTGLQKIQKKKKRKKIYPATSCGGVL